MPNAWLLSNDVGHGTRLCWCWSEGESDYLSLMLGALYRYHH